MLLSIIIPVYNVEKYLAVTLKNILNQSFTDYELLLIDDGSADGSSDICDEFAKSDSRVRIIHQQNAGVSAARNMGVASAKGRYIGFVDSDDLIEPNMFEILISIAEEYQADIVQCRHNRMDSVQKVTYSNVKRIIDGSMFVKELFDYNGGEYTNQVALWSKIYRRELFSGILFPKGRTYEDEQETYKICLKANKIIQIPDELYHYVRRENSIITGVSLKKMLDKQMALLDRLDYLPAKMPELEEKCARSFIVYSEGIICQLYDSREHEGLEDAIDNLLSRKKLIQPYLSKYEKIYYIFLRHVLVQKVILGNQFMPIQKFFAKVKGFIK